MESIGLALSICGITVTYILGYQAVQGWNNYKERKKLEELLEDYDYYNPDILSECDDEDIYEGFSLVHSPDVDPIQNEEIWLIVNYSDDGS